MIDIANTQRGLEVGVVCSDVKGGNTVISYIKYISAFFQKFVFKSRLRLPHTFELRSSFLASFDLINELTQRSSDASEVRGAFLSLVRARFRFLME